jgi:uncharacterized protein (TIGR00251 family)
MRITQAKEGAIVKVFVKPGSPSFRVVVDGDEVVVHCTEEPVKGKVNKELVKEMSKLFGSRVELVSGFTSRQKLLLVVGLGKDEVERVIRKEGTR